jgi:hypothetical protein
LGAVRLERRIRLEVTMTDDPRQLARRILALSREDTLEAATALARLLSDDGVEPPPAAAGFLEGVKQQPLAHTEEVDGLSRVLLLEAAADPELADDVEEILDATGRTAFIFGGAEIVALAGLAVIALQTVLSRGRKREQRKTEYEVDETGRPIKLVVHEEVEYGLSAGVGGIVSSVQPPAA